MKFIITILSTIIMFSCTSTKINTGMMHESAPVIIYKTSGDYSKNVPIMLNQSKDKIISYPAPSDMTYEGEIAYPVKLKKGFLLDRRGIGPNSVFTKYTYEEYSMLKSTPTLDELMESVIDMDPFIGIYICGNTSNFKDLRKELNEIIYQNCMKCEELSSK